MTNDDERANLDYIRTALATRHRALIVFIDALERVHDQTDDDQIRLIVHRALGDAHAVLTECTP